MNQIANISLKAEGKIIGRIGGNLPDVFLARKEEIEGYRFYMTFQNPDEPQTFLSIFIPDDYEVMLDNSIYPNCSIKVFSHAFSKESDDSTYTLTGMNKAYIGGYGQVDASTFDFITKASTPKLIQEEAYYSDTLEKDGYRFFLQIDEDYYPEALLNGGYVFGYGALYLYRHEDSGEVIVGFWQYS